MVLWISCKNLRLARGIPSGERRAWVLPQLAETFCFPDHTFLPPEPAHNGRGGELLEGSDYVALNPDLTTKFIALDMLLTCFTSGSSALKENHKIILRLKSNNPWKLLSPVFIWHINPQWILKISYSITSNYYYQSYRAILIHGSVL